MPFTIIVGAQFGDEGKGKFVDLLAEQQDIIVRFQGGNNAGHTVVVDCAEYKFHLLPSGIIQGKRVLLASGVVIDPKVLLSEIKALGEKQYSSLNLGIDVRSNIIMPYHILLDKAREKAANKPIGTTGRGIGPCYEDKVGRRGVTFFDLIDSARLRQRLEVIYPEKKAMLESVYHEQLLSSEEIVSEYAEYGKELSQYITDVSLEISQNSNNKILFEGAQGTFLDVAFGTYPYVTSSHTIAANAFVQAGIPTEKSMIIGIAKAYTTRVGSGPFVTELIKGTDAIIGDYIRKQGVEYGTTTGRPRRCGWLDLFMLKESARINGLTALAITKLDVLSGLDEIKICIAYLLNGKQLENFPHDSNELEKCTPIYEILPGFKLTPELIRSKTLPENAVQYLRFIQKKIGIPINFVSIGPERNQTIVYDKGVE
jgi:adenylosuccinate synthase